MVAMRARDASRGLHTGVNMPGKYIHEETATPISIYLYHWITSSTGYKWLP